MSLHILHQLFVSPSDITTINPQAKKTTFSAAVRFLKHLCHYQHLSWMSLPVT
jgi:hypothetical protein